MHPSKDLRILGLIFVDNGSRTAIVHVHFEGPISERLGNITGEMTAETLRNCLTRYYGAPDAFHSDPEGCFASNTFNGGLSAMNITFLPEPGKQRGE